ncbi:hypothetical protein Mal15_55060 [Stieleria maiorica]|uniref:N-acetyltransferase domain-containing protein n=1 Tax=Stieleria maiorica TaxID=2795974 RepID=A0A5B9MLZ3_9BACT|nr:GNAT family N-acetyltransferase [Stieleria maiorica]QEG01430.1 hypothetical protein Mal15_55060 [Stieleria maiorica]
MLIRRLVQGDRDGLFAIYGDAENARYNFYRPWTIEQIESHIDAQSQIDVDSPGIAVMLAAFLQDSDELVGCIELTNVSPDDRQSEIGYSFNRSYTGKGLATEAVVGVLGYAFNCLG